VHHARQRRVRLRVRHLPVQHASVVHHHDVARCSAVPKAHLRRRRRGVQLPVSEKGVRLAQKTQVGTCNPVRLKKTILYNPALKISL
jgi:hypothetical protein